MKVRSFTSALTISMDMHLGYPLEHESEDEEIRAMWAEWFREQIKDYGANPQALVRCFEITNKELAEKAEEE